MKKLFAIFLSLMMTLCFCIEVNAYEIDSLYALSAVLIDADSGRVLYGKNENDIRAMASTTKIMTLMLALNYGEMDEEVIFSKYACKEPDVQLNALNGERYCLKDLLYIMMLKSYNDVAMAVAEHIGAKLNGDTSINNSDEESIEDVSRFVLEMNNKAKELGLENTYFITPNGLDAKDENGIHSTTAYELALIAREAIKDERFVEICTTRSYTYRELSGKRTGTINNADRFLDMQSGAIGIKTGFTGEAGYCFVGALRQDERTFISVVLASGWPNNKNYKWSDTKKLMNYGTNNYFCRNVFSNNEDYKEVDVINGLRDSVMTYIPFEVNYLLSDEDNVEIVYKMDSYINAPVNTNVQVGTVYIYINDKLERTLPILTKNAVGEKKFLYYWKKVIKSFLM